jgi:hypothetical protein
MLRLSTWISGFSLPNQQCRHLSSGSIYSFTSKRLIAISPEDEADAKRASAELANLQPPVEPTTCCGNGCAECVWLSYAEEVENYHHKVQELQKRIAKLRSINGVHQEEHTGLKLSPEEVAKQKLNEAMQTMDVSMQMFLTLENNLRKKNKE